MAALESLFLSTRPSAPAASLLFQIFLRDGMLCGFIARVFYFTHDREIEASKVLVF